ncbi:MAG: cation transporter [Chromatiaceae bacterium]|nr:MAG: cation transporter [Chromatiaceae bacterium]
MHTHDLSLWTHDHDFGSVREGHAERRTRWVVALTLGAMLIELTAGWFTGSMALLADGWHMGSHAAALGVAAYAYAFARRHRSDRRFSFGTGKVGSLAGWSSALLLGAGALWMLVESASRFVAPLPIRYAEALLVAVLGLTVNLISAWLLRGDDHDHPGHVHADHNLAAAYLHVLADAATSVLALLALGLGMALGWAFLDPLMGIVGGLLVGSWAFGLARRSAAVLLDADDHGYLARTVRTRIEQDADNQIADLHLWRIGPGGFACIVALVTHAPRPVAHYRALLAQVPGLLHVTIEVNQCHLPACGPPATAARGGACDAG